MRNAFWLVALVVMGCGGSSDDGLSGTGGKNSGGAGGSSASGGSSGSSSGGSSATGGVAGGSGTGGSGTGGTTTGGTGGTATGGTGGATGGTGGTATGGTGGATGGTGGATGGTGGATGGTGGTATGGTGGATGGTGGTATGGTGGATGGTGGTATGGTGGTGACGGQSCGTFSCCDSKCVNTKNDIKNCGSCGNVCPSGQSFCDNGTCKAPPCGGGVACIGTKFCCGSECCDLNQLCCLVQGGGPVQTQPKCTTPVNGTCPTGCNGCVCNSPDTPIATPNGNRLIDELREGDLVYSIHEGRVRAVRIARVVRQDAPNHVVVEVKLASGTTLHISPKHPTADGRTFGQLTVGDQLDGIAVTEVRLVPFEHSHTVDILPDSDTGMYYAGGVLIGSTIAGAGAGISASGALAVPKSL